MVVFGRFCRAGVAQLNVIGVAPYVPQPQDFQWSCAFVLQIGANLPERLDTLPRRQNFLAFLCKSLNRSADCAGLTTGYRDLPTTSYVAHGIVISATSAADMTTLENTIRTTIPLATDSNGIFFQELKGNGFKNMTLFSKLPTISIKQADFAAETLGLSFVLTVSTNVSITKQDQIGIIAGISKQLTAYTNHIQVIDVSPTSLFGPNATDIGIYVQSVSTSAGVTNRNHMDGMTEKLLVPTGIFTDIRDNGMPGIQSIRIVNRALESSTPSSTLNAANTSTLGTMVLGVSDTYLASTPAKAAFAGAFAQSTGVRPECVFVQSATPAGLGLLVEVSFTCDNTQQPFKTVGAASDHAAAVLAAHLPSPGKSNTIIDALHSSGLVSITLCGTPMLPTTATNIAVYVGATVASSLLLASGCVTLVVVALSKKSNIAKVGSNQHNQMVFTTVQPTSRVGWRQRFTQR
jgi:predicted amino acid-binding ACT domain protein